MLAEIAIVSTFSWASFLTYALITAITPGPNNIMSMSNAGRLGFRKAFPFNLGIFCGFVIVMIACTLFCSLLSAIIPKIKLPMLIIGAAYILYLAYKTWKSSDVIEENFSRIGFLSGLTLQFINPKIYIYAIVSMEAYILSHYSDNMPMLILLYCLLLLDLCAHCYGLLLVLFLQLFFQNMQK